MNKKTMQTITGVLSIVFGALMVFCALFMFLCYGMTTAEILEEALTGEVYTQEELDMFVQLVRGFFMGAGVCLLLFAIANIIMGSFLISKAGKKQNATGLLIAILIVNALVGNVITLLFAILALCAKYPEKIEPLDDPFGTKSPEIVVEDINKTDN